MRSDYDNYFEPEVQAVIRNQGIDWSIIQFAKDHQKILDAGAGAGILAYKLRELGKDVTCIDISKKNVDYLHKLALKAVQCDICKLPFKDNEFDLAIAEEVIEHLVNPGEGIKELCRVAKNVIITMPKMFKDEWHLWDIDYIPYVSAANCIVLKLTKKEESINKEKNG